ncbi:MAG: Deoxyuridine 5'-triphosphate nucleotidohydrolase [Parcubacteria group bacterium ADurb.Bin326]|nr:MAG: Deoxyuridine 5'-triphosphate nucleotidohydrolase [Parcubacteria group bacterium ADurb.Bin326]
MLNVKIKKLVSEAITPKYAKPGDAGMDVYAVSKNETDKYIEYGTGLAFEILEGYVMLIFPRSSVSNTDLVMANSVGVLDSGYRGELKLRFRKNGSDDYQVGDRVGQIIVLPYPAVNFEEVEDLSESIRGEGGFGSSGKN